MADQVNLLFRGRHPQERQDVVLPDGLHLRLRAGDVVGVTPEQADWLLAYQHGYVFRRTDAEPRKAVSAHDVQHDAGVTAGGQ